MANTGIDPRIGAWCNFLFVVLTGIAAGAVAFAGFSDATVTFIKTYAADGAFLISCANLVFHLYSSTETGPMVKL